MTGTTIDRAALKKLLEVLGGDPEDLAELMGDYVEDAPELARQIADAAAAEDRDALRIAAHTLKSNSRDFGAVALAELCADLEHACREGMPADAVTAAKRIAGEEAAARQALSEIDPRSLVGQGPA